MRGERRSWKQDKAGRQSHVIRRETDKKFAYGRGYLNMDWVDDIQIARLFPSEGYARRGIRELFMEPEEQEQVANGTWEPGKYSIVPVTLVPTGNPKAV